MNSSGWLSKLQTKIGYRFKEPALAVRAMTHRGYSSRRGVQSYNRLEFLGNFVLDLFLAEFLYRSRTGERSEGLSGAILGQLRSNALLTAIGDRLGIREHIMLEGGHSHTKYVADVLEALIGVIYLEEGQSGAYRVLAEWFAPELEEICKSSNALKGSVTLELETRE